MRDESYIVSWKQIVKQDFLQEFCRVTKALIFAGQAGLPQTEKAVKKIMDGLPEETRDRYHKTLFSLEQCGYFYDKWGIPYYCGWFDPRIINGTVQFRTSAPAPQRFISMRPFMDFKRELKEDLSRSEQPLQPGPLADEVGGFVIED